MQEEFRNKTNILNNTEQLSKANTSLKNTIKEQDKIISEKLIEIEDANLRLDECQSDLNTLENKYKIEKENVTNIKKEIENKDIEIDSLKNQIKESQGMYKIFCFYIFSCLNIYLFYRKIK